MSAPATNNSLFFLRSFALEGWYEENPHTPKLKDIEEAISAMNFIGNYLGKKYKLIKELDLERTGANTPKKPEARFEFADSKKKKKSVIEIKQFPFEVNKGKATLLFTQPKLFKWFLDFHQSHADEDHRILFQLKVKQTTFNPGKTLRDLKHKDPFDGISTEFLELKAVKWHRSEVYQLTDDWALHFSECEGRFIVIEESNSPIDISAAIDDSTNYERYVDLLYETWIKDEWDKKFHDYKKDSKFLYLKIIMSPTSQLAVFHDAFSLKDFVETILAKYGNSKSLSQLQGILFYVAGTYQLIELTKKGPIYHPKQVAPFP